MKGANMQGQLSQSRVASVILLLIGIWVALSPMWISVTGGALTSIIITGVVMALAGLTQYFTRASWPSWIAGLAAVWLFVSTFVFSVDTGAAWNQIIAAIVAFVLAYWDGFEITQVQHHQMHGAM
jgi:hypothetical protein